MAVVNWRGVDLSGDWSARRRGEQILAALPADAAYLGTCIDIPLLEYLQIVELQRVDVQPVNVFFTRAAPERVAAAMLRLGRPVYTSQTSLAEDGDFELEPEDASACYRVHPARAPRFSDATGLVCWAPPRR